MTGFQHFVHINLVTPQPKTVTNFLKKKTTTIKPVRKQNLCKLVSKKTTQLEKKLIQIT